MIKKREFMRGSWMWIVDTFPLDIRLSAIAKPAWRLPHVIETLGKGGQNSLI